MRLNVILRYVGVVMLIMAGFMAASTVVAAADGPDSAFYPLLLSTLLTALLGCMPLIFVESQHRITNREGFCIVVGSWQLACVVGMFPYLIWGGEFSLINAWFESVSGFTTTGASILQDVESLPRGLLLWRACTTWIGGMGVVMFALVVLPAMGANKIMYSGGEMSSLARDDYRYRAQIIVRILLVVYFGLTALFTVLLRAADMSWFDALCHSMSACASSGFSNYNTSVAHFDNVWVEVILGAALVASGLHFGMIYATVTGRTNSIFRSEVARAYLLIALVCSILIAINIYASGVYTSIWAALRYGTFQFVSIFSTSGFATADTTAWPPFSVALLIFGSLVCACAGSTSGGLKVNRLLLALKMFRTRIRQRQHPHAVIRIKLDGILQDADTLSGVVFFIVAYLMLVMVGTLLITLFGVDLMTAFSGSVASIGNVGPGFGAVGSMGNYALQPAGVKFILASLMLLGRLEIFGLLQFFLFRWWR